MKSIVVITTDSGIKRNFANLLATETNGAVKCVIIQKVPPKFLIKKISSFIKKIGLINTISETFYFLLNKSPKNKEVLAWFKERTANSENEKDWLAPIKVVSDINSDESYLFLQNINPDIIVIWGGSILKKRILDLAKYCLNIHSGVAPLYRGVSCNQHAILNNDFSNIGITIHYANKQVDSGDIIEIIKAKTNQRPKECFKQLNDEALDKYKAVIKSILMDKKIEGASQNLSSGQQYLLKDWGFKKDFQLVKKLLEWDKLNL